MNFEPAASPFLQIPAIHFHSRRLSLPFSPRPNVSINQLKYFGRPHRLRGNEIEQTTTTTTATTTTTETETVDIQFGMQEMIHLSYDILIRCSSEFIGVDVCM